MNSHFDSEHLPVYRNHIQLCDIKFWKKVQPSAESALYAFILFSRYKIATEVKCYNAIVCSSDSVIINIMAIFTVIVESGHALFVCWFIKKTTKTWPSLSAYDWVIYRLQSWLIYVKYLRVHFIWNLGFQKLLGNIVFNHKMVLSQIKKNRPAIVLIFWETDRKRRSE